MIFSASESIFSINIPYPRVGSFTNTCVTAPIILSFWMIGLPLIPCTIPPVFSISLLSVTSMAPGFVLSQAVYRYYLNIKNLCLVICAYRTHYLGIALFYLVRRCRGKERIFWHIPARNSVHTAQGIVRAFTYKLPFVDCSYYFAGSAFFAFFYIKNRPGWAVVLFIFCLCLGQEQCFLFFKTL